MPSSCIIPRYIWSRDFFVLSLSTLMKGSWPMFEIPRYTNNLNNKKKKKRYTGVTEPTYNQNDNWWRVRTFLIPNTQETLLGSKNEQWIQMLFVRSLSRKFGKTRSIKYHVSTVVTCNSNLLSKLIQLHPEKPGYYKSKESSYIPVFVRSFW